MTTGKNNTYSGFSKACRCEEKYYQFVNCNKESAKGNVGESCNVHCQGTSKAIEKIIDRKIVGSV